MQMRAIGVLSLVSLLGSQACGNSPGAAQQGGIRTTPAAEYLVEAFSRFPLVAFSEPRHGAGGTREFLKTLVQHPRFAGAVDDIVVEFGNARFQVLADRYVFGEPVAREELKQIWEDTTIVSGVWTAPMYEGMLADVRALNESLPPSRRVRVLLGDPPIDWSVVRGPADEDMNDWRDAHFAWVVEEQVIKKHRRALIWIGGAHLSRLVRFPNSLIHLLDRRFPNQTLVALSIDRQEVDQETATRLGEWRSLAATPVAGTWFGQLDVSRFGWRLSTGTIEQNIDVAIFWPFPAIGPDEAPRVVAESPEGLELRRRQRLAEETTAFRGGRIRFEDQSTALTPLSEPALRTVLEELRRDTGLHVMVKAFADAREVGGLHLSEARARVVVRWLVARGIPSSRLEPKGCGSSRALWVGHTEDERAANRQAGVVRISRWAGCDPPASFDFR